MWMYYCRHCGKILGESTQGKKGVFTVAVDGYCCMKPTYSIKRIRKEVEKRLK